MKEYLPIGSIVTLKDGKKPLMVVGWKQIDKDNNEFDYVGLPHPEGFINSDLFFLFNQKDVKQVDFIGYVNSATQALNVKFNELESKEKESKKND